MARRVASMKDCGTTTCQVTAPAWSMVQHLKSLRILPDTTLPASGRSFISGRQHSGNTVTTCVFGMVPECFAGLVQQATSYIFYAQGILRLMPDARFLYLLRNPYDICASEKCRAPRKGSTLGWRCELESRTSVGDQASREIRGSMPHCATRISSPNRCDGFARFSTLSACRFARSTSTCRT